MDKSGGDKSTSCPSYGKVRSSKSADMGQSNCSTIWFTWMSTINNDWLQKCYVFLLFVIIDCINKLLK